jgi:hypothetical protein
VTSIDGHYTEFEHERRIIRAKEIGRELLSLLHGTFWR